ncbi:MAG: GNAT family N-acetyltransferase [Chloroflexota bacterium]
MSQLVSKRRAIRHLLREQDPADGMAAYYAFYHPDEKTNIVIMPEEGARADGYVAVSRTGIDLFRPLVTMRLPVDQGPQGYGASLALLRRTLGPGMPVFLSVPQRYMPLIRAVFDIQAEEVLRIYALDTRRFEPVINVLVVQSTGANGLPTYLIQSRQDGEPETVAMASLNWLSPYFGEIAVMTKPEYRRQGWGQSVVSAMVQYLLENGRTPLYAVNENNRPSVQLAGNIGFTDSGAREYLLQASIGGVKEA